MDALTTIGSVLGMILGTSGLTVSLLNYLRDRPQVKVTLSWDMVNTRTGEVDGLVRVTNTGRRAVFISATALEIPNSPEIHVLQDSISGVKLAEGDKPAAYLVSREWVAVHVGKWRKMRAFVEVSTGGKYYSAYPRRNEPPPNWATAKNRNPPGL